MTKKTKEDLSSIWQDGRLSEKQIIAALTQSSGQPLKVVAEAAGVSTWTIGQWQKLAPYRSLVGHYLADLEKSTLRTLTNARRLAVERLTKIVSDPNSDDRAAISAAGILLSQPVPTHPLPRMPEEIERDDRQMEQLEHIFSGLGMN